MSDKDIKKLNDRIEALYKEQTKTSKILEETNTAKDKAADELRKCKKFEGKIDDPKLKEKLNKEIEKLEKKIKEADAKILKLNDVFKQIAKQVETCDIQLRTIKKNLDSMTLDYVLANKEMLALFMAYAKKVKIDNELDFVIAVANKDNPLTIYKDYVSERGKYQVNISGALRKPLDEMAEEKNYKAMNFTKCANHVRSTIWGDHRAKFINTLTA